MHLTMKCGLWIPLACYAYDFRFIYHHMQCAHAFHVIRYKFNKRVYIYIHTNKQTIIIMVACISCIIVCLQINDADTAGFNPLSPNNR